MAGKQLEATARAVEAYKAGATVRAAAAAENITEATLQRALTRAGVPRRGPARGADHPSYIDGRKAAAEAARAARAAARSAARGTGAASGQR